MLKSLCFLILYVLSCNGSPKEISSSHTGVDEDDNMSVCYAASSANPKNSAFIFRVKQFKERDYFL